MSEAIPRLQDLLTYIEKVEASKSKPAFSVPTEFFVSHEHELVGLPEIEFNTQTDDGDVWLRLPRLQEIPVPSVEGRLKPWVSLPKSPEKKPELKTSIAVDFDSEGLSRQLLSDHPEIEELFDWYLTHQWEPWSGTEQLRRKAIARYNQLFTLHQSIALEGGETALELVWGVGYAAWKVPGHASTPIQHPLLVQACEIVLDEKTFDLEIRPREVDPRLELDCYAALDCSGVLPLETFWKSALAAGATGVNPFEESTFEHILKAAVGHLDSSGKYETRGEDVKPPNPAETLTVTNTWVLFSRKRSTDIFIEDVRRLQAKLENISSLPGVLASFVVEGDDTIPTKADKPFRGLSNSESPAGAMELYFPKPYNDEQVSIIQHLEHSDGTVVQGPPGTGKTHTIANVVSHYLALGKRVLVTAKSDSALAVLQEKLPERIRPLSVALLSDERDGMKQFEHSIEKIASSVAKMNEQRADSSIANLEASLNHLHSQIAFVDQTISSFASKHMTPYKFQGKSVTPAELAALVTEQAEEHDWLNDEPPATEEGLPPFDDAQVHSARKARIAAGDDLRYLGASLPANTDFPDALALTSLHRDLLKARAIEGSVSSGTIIDLVDTRTETFEKAQLLLKFLEERAELKTIIASSGQQWSQGLEVRLRSMSPTDPLWTALRTLCGEIGALDQQRKELLAQAVHLPVDAELNEDFCAALTRLLEGKSAFALPFGRGEARKLVAAATVLGSEPACRDDWSSIQHLADWRRAARKELSRWNSLCAEFALEGVDGPVDASFRRLAEARSTVDDVATLVFSYEKTMHGHIAAVFGKGAADLGLAAGEGGIEALLNSLVAHVDKGRLAYATQRIDALLQKLDNRRGDVVEGIRQVLDEAVGDADIDENDLQKRWRDFMADLVRMAQLRPAFEEIERFATALDKAGAALWASRVRTVIASPESDPVLPNRWLEAWNWRQASLFLSEIDEHDKLRGLFKERNTLTSSLARTYQDLVAEKTWLGVFRNSPTGVRQALQSYLGAIQAMGAGTGRRAIRHRRTAREAMEQAYRAVPCWVLPHWRVSETLPSEIGLFDLVIIDEASQSDIWALPALMRGKKILVVGDHKQVSPSAVGMAEDTILDLSARFLEGQPHKAHMTPERSIYDLATVVFAGSAVMLKEHFRCVPAIIEFSNREFYKNEIKPLRLPKANERLDPPLVDVFVKGGMRDRKDVNRAEAEAIVQEIESILADEQFAGRTIGVVTLLGTAQAAFIQREISNRISPADVVARKLAVGPPPVFQGRERDIMMVSMVIGPGERAAANRADIAQRFNVALSRARDRMYLFRSVHEAAYGEDTLNARLMRHFRQPFLQEPAQVEHLREKCESGFELEIFDELVKRGYRVQPQVPCAGFRIDFVVEGSDGRRLAVECDGDRFHGPGQWADDMARQRVLERAGWTFWRCFASSFVRRREEVLHDLIDTLHNLGIKPIGSASVDSSTWVLSKEVDPLGVDKANGASDLAVKEDLASEENEPDKGGKHTAALARNVSPIEESIAQETAP